MSCPTGWNGTTGFLPIDWRKIASLTMSAVSSSFSSTLQHALVEERHFALVDDLPVPTQARS